MPKYVYDLSEGSADMRSLLGGKGANVAEMRRIGVPVPDGFTVTTEACVATMRDGSWPDGLEAEIEAGWSRSRIAPAASSASASGRCSCRCAPAPCTRCRA